MRRRKFRVYLVLPALIFLFLSLLATPALAPPPAEDCRVPNHGLQQQWRGVWYECDCIDPETGDLDPEACRWEKVPKVASNQRAKNTRFIHSATNSFALVSPSIDHHVGGYGNFGDTEVQLFGTSWNRLSRDIAARVIVGRWTGSSWQTCHDSNWHYVSPSTTHSWREPADCGSGYYRAQGAGRYWSNSLGNWITTGWAITESLCISPSPCDLRLAPPDVKSTA